MRVSAFEPFLSSRKDDSIGTNTLAINEYAVSTRADGIWDQMTFVSTVRHFGRDTVAALSDGTACRFDSNDESNASGRAGADHGNVLVFGHIGGTHYVALKIEFSHVIC